MPLDAQRKIVDFWFEEAGPKKWYAKDPAFDAEIARRFEADLIAQSKILTDEGRSPWEETAAGTLALVILLDQFPRNMYRDTPNAFAYDPLALAAAKRALDQGVDLQVPAKRRAFLYLPLMHSESLEDQDRCIALCESRLADPENAKYAHAHRDIIAQFGRFPHRNRILGRDTTEAEAAFLETHSGV